MTCNWPYHYCANLGMLAADALSLLRSKAHAAYPPTNPMTPFILPDILEAIDTAENFGCVNLANQCKNIKDAHDQADAGNWADVIVELEQLGDPGDSASSSSDGDGTTHPECDFTHFRPGLQRALYRLARHMGRHFDRTSSDQFRDRFWACMVAYAEEFKPPSR